MHIKGVLWSGSMKCGGQSQRAHSRIRRRFPDKRFLVITLTLVVYFDLPKVFQNDVKRRIDVTPSERCNHTIGGRGRGRRRRHNGEPVRVGYLRNGGGGRGQVPSRPHSVRPSARRNGKWFVLKPVLLESPFRQMAFAGNLFVFIRQENGNGSTFSWPVPARDVSL